MDNAASQGPPAEGRRRSLVRRALSRTLGLVLVIGAVLGIFVVAAPLRRLAADYRTRIVRLATAKEGLMASKSGAGRGFETLPPLVVAMHGVLEREKLSEYWVDPGLPGSGQLWQRVVEGNWPRVPRSTARAVFQPLGRSRTPACRVIPMPTVSYELAICP